MAVLNADQQRAEDLVLEGRNVFITGAAGTGKSMLLRSTVEKLRAAGKRVAVTASTGMAACLIGGTTLHSWAGLGLGEGELPRHVGMVKKKRDKLSRWVKTDVLIIDEVSMLDFRYLTMLEKVGRAVRPQKDRPFGGLQVVLYGDFFQLPPVQPQAVRLKNGGPVFLFQTEVWSEVVERQVQLTETYRQKDPRFLKILSEVRVCEMTSDTVAALRGASKGEGLAAVEGILPTRLSAMRKDVEAINLGELRALPGPTTDIDAQDTTRAFPGSDGKRGFMLRETLRLKVGAQVMVVKNLPEVGLVNGSRGVVKEFIMSQGEEPRVCAVRIVAMDGATHNIEYYEEKLTDEQGNEVAVRTQIPLDLAWAITIHKSQGQTIDLLDVDLNGVFEYAQVYVALSRGVGLDRMIIRNFKPSGVKVSSVVRNFYANFTEVPTGEVTFYDDKKKGSLPNAVVRTGREALRTKRVTRDWDEWLGANKVHRGPQVEE